MAPRTSLPPARRLAGLAAAAVVAASSLLAPTPAHAVGTTITFDELSSRDADGVSLKGATFTALTESHPIFGAHGMSTQNPKLVGGTASDFRVDFAQPTPNISFGVQYATAMYNAFTPGQVVAAVDLYSTAGTLLETKDITVASSGGWHHEYPYYYFVASTRFTHQGTTKVARIDVRNLQKTATWHIDNLTYEVGTLSGAITNGGFESGDLTGWNTTGNAFSVSSATDWGWGGPFNHKGARHIWGFAANGDAGTGTLTSPMFNLSGGKPYVDFLVGGGNDSARLYVALVVDGVEVLKASGTDNERYRRVIWDTSTWAGKDAYFKVVDTATGGWGHINVDDFHTQADTVASGTWGALTNKGFEDGSLTGWTTTGTAYVAADVTSTNTWWGGTFSYVGAKHLSALQSGRDADTGSISSAAFVLGGLGRVDFLTSGGNNAAELRVELVRASDDSVLFSATGNNSETYQRISWDASEYIGETLMLRVTDTATGDWGHLNLDDVNVHVKV